jgi:hypothetical protein
MAKALLTIAYRQTLDASSQGDFEKGILYFSYEEFKLKSQAYNPEGRWNTFSELKAADGRANSLHYKTGFAVTGLIQTLHNKIPVLKDTLGRQLVFETHQFELIESALDNKLLHQVAIHYFTPVLKLHAIIGEHLLLSYTDQDDKIPADTFLLVMQPGLSISNYQELSANSNSVSLNMASSV